MLLQRVSAGKSSVRPMIYAARSNLRFNSTTILTRNAAIQRVSEERSSLALQEFKNVFKSSEDRFKKYENIVSSIEKENLGSFSERALSIVENDEKVLYSLLNETLTNGIKISDLSLKNISRVVSTIDKKLSRDLELALLKLGEEYPSFIELLEYNVGLRQNNVTSGLIVSLYLQGKEIEKPSTYVFELLRENKDINKSTIELIIYHNPNIKLSSDILHLSELKEININSAILKKFFQKAIDLDEVEIVYSHYDYILKKIIIDKDYLVKLLSIIGQVGYIREVKKIYKMILNYDGVEPDYKLKKLYKNLVAESASRVHGFNRGFKHIENSVSFNKRYSVKDYPELVDAMTISAKSRKLEQVLYRRMNHNDSIPILKSFYLNLILAKLIQLNKMEMALEIILKHTKIRRYLDFESIELLILGISKENHDENVKQLLRIIEIKDEKIDFKQRKDLLDLLFELTINSQYWYKVFMIIENCKFKNYEINPKLSEILKNKCIENALLHLYNDLDCVPEDTKETELEEWEK